MIKALIFDCYGTIVSTGTSSVDATRIILKNLNSNIDPIKFYSDWKKIHKENINKLRHFCKEEKIFENDLKILLEKYNIKGNPKIDVKPMINALYGRKFYDDVINNLKELKKVYEIYIGSNSDTEPLLENIGNDIYLFNGIYTSEILKTYKPSKIFFEKLIEKIRHDKNGILFIGDSFEDDILGASKAGLKTVFVNRKNNILNIDDIATYNIKDFYELKEILLNE